jgi:2'-5' RNA ligase
VVEAIEGRLARVAKNFAPLQARARGLGAFPSPERPNVLWVGVEAEGLIKLQRDVEGQLAELGFDQETRPFHPHVTVGRVKHAADLKATWTGDGELAASPFAEIIVYESRTLQKGAEYLARARIPLGK